MAVEFCDGRIGSGGSAIARALRKRTDFPADRRETG